MTKYRGIALLSIATKIFNRMLLNRIKPAIDPVLRPNQAGFRTGRSTIGQLNSLRCIFEGVDLKKLPLIITFVGFKKASYSINRERMFIILLAYGIPPVIVSAISKLYTNTRADFEMNGTSTDLFDINKFVLQEDTLAPFLFIIVIDYVMRKSEHEHGFTY